MTGARLIAAMQYVNKDAILMGHIHALRQENVILHEKINQILAHKPHEAGDGVKQVQTRLWMVKVAAA